VWMGGAVAAHPLQEIKKQLRFFVREPVIIVAGRDCLLY
jgi:hypothetical protein